MGKIKKLLETDLKNGIENIDIYPVTSTKAVFDTSNTSLDNIIEDIYSTIDQEIANVYRDLEDNVHTLNQKDTELSTNINSVINSKGKSNGYASLDGNGNLEISQIPESVKNVLPIYGVARTKSEINASHFPSISNLNEIICIEDNNIYIYTENRFVISFNKLNTTTIYVIVGKTSVIDESTYKTNTIWRYDPIKGLTSLSSENSGGGGSIPNLKTINGESLIGTGDITTIGTKGTGNWAHILNTTGNKSSGNFALAINFFTQALGDNSLSGGANSVSKGHSSTALGYSTITNNFGEVALGRCNKSNSTIIPGENTWVGDSNNTLFSIGNGRDESSRSNAFEVMQDGTIYILKPGTTERILLQNSLGSSGGGSTGNVFIPTDGSPTKWLKWKSTGVTEWADLPVAIASTSASSGSSGIMTADDKRITNKLLDKDLLDINTTIDYGDKLVGVKENKLFLKRSVISTKVSVPAFQYVEIPEATTEKNGLMSIEDKIAIENIKNSFPVQRKYSDTTKACFWYNLFPSIDNNKLFMLTRNEDARFGARQSELYESYDGYNWTLLSVKASADNTTPGIACGDAAYGHIRRYGEEKTEDKVISYGYYSDTNNKYYEFDNKSFNQSLNKNISLLNNSNSKSVIPFGNIMYYNNYYYFLGYWRNKNTFGKDGIWRGIDIFKVNALNIDNNFYDSIENSGILVDFSENTPGSTPTSINSSSVFVNEPESVNIEDNVFTVIRCVGDSVNSYNKGFYLSTWKINTSPNYKYNTSSTLPSGIVFIDTSSFSSGGHKKGVLPRIGYFKKNNEYYLFILLYIRCDSSGQEYSDMKYATLKLGDLLSLNSKIDNAKRKLIWKNFSFSTSMKHNRGSSSPEGGNSGMCSWNNKIYIAVSNKQLGDTYQYLIIDPLKDIEITENS